MFGIQDDYMNLLISICATNGLAMRIDYDGILVFRDGEEDYLFENRLGTLIGKLLYTDTGLDVNYILTVEELKLIDDEKFYEIFKEYREDVQEKFSNGTHEYVKEAQALADSIGDVCGISFDVVTGKINIPDELLVILHDKSGEPMHKTYTPHTLKGQALLHWFVQKGVDQQIQKGMEKFDTMVAQPFYTWFTQEGIVEYMVRNTVGDATPMPSLMDICRSAISDLMADIEVRQAMLLSEDEFIEHCDLNDVYFNADGILVNGEIY